MQKIVLPLLVMVFGLALAACDKKEAVKPPDPGTNVTTAKVVRHDMPVTEAAVGTMTSLSMAQALDPTRLSAISRTVRLPFPQHVVQRLRIGQAVSLTSFEDPQTVAHGRVLKILPSLNISTDSIEVIVSIDDRPNWQPRGSIRGEVVMSVNAGALVVPEQAVAIRPAGTVVYTVINGTVKANTVTTGIVRDGLVEVREGLKSGDTVVVDGASLLSDGAKINVRDAGGAPGQGQKQS
jgi:RND family efflux transporter MFP subunit